MLPPDPPPSPPSTQESGLAQLCDAHVFAEARAVTEALRRRDCGPALAWCADNRAKLRKAKSKLEFRLRVQVGWHPPFLCSTPRS